MIIIIDDDSTFREVLARSLQRRQQLVRHFASPELALATIEETDNPVILLDLKLDGDSGLLWIERLKKINSSARLILLTGYASISTAVEAIKLGADDYLTKPTTAREILEHLNKGFGGDPECEIAEQPMSVERLQWEHIQRVLNNNNGNISAAARALGMHRRTLQRRLAKKPAKR